MKNTLKKKIIAASMALITCVLGAFVGCGKSETDFPDYNGNNPSGTPGTSNPSGTPETPEKIAAPYTADDLQSVIWMDKNQGYPIDVSANTYLRTLLLSVEYYAAQPQENDGGAKDKLEATYILTLPSVELCLYDANTVEFVFKDETKPMQTATVKDDGLAYVFDLTDGEPLSIDGYTESQKITVVAADKKGGELSDKTAFLQKWNTLRFVKLKNKSHYQPQTAYTLSFDELQITVHATSVEWNGELYALTHGDFSFFQSLKYKTDSGWLPWI